MKQEITNIYRALAAGKLSQQEALERIKALNKQPVKASPIATLLASPVWERCAAPAAAKDDAAAFSEHHIILCDLPQIAAAELEALLPGSRCTSVNIVTGALSQGYADIALHCFEAIRRILESRPQGSQFVQIVVADRDDAQMFAGLSGMIDTAALENPGIVGQIVLVRPAIPGGDLARRLRTEVGNPQDRVVHYTADSRLARRWRTVDMPAAAPCAFREHGVYLITGGLGGLGALVAAEILRATTGASVVLTGRSSDAGIRLAALQKSGRVEYRQMDVRDAAGTQRVLASIVDQYGRLDGIIHSAGIVHDDFILKKGCAQFSEVLQPKVAGTEHLDLASQDIDLDFFVLFSSIASWSGNVGQADYTAANGFMDQFAGYRNALVDAGKRKGRTVAIAWPHWVDGGMHIDADSSDALQQRTGLRSLATDQGMEAFKRCLALPHSLLMVMHGDRAGMQRALAAERTIRKSAAKPAAVAGSADLAAKTRAFLRAEFAAILKIPVHRIDTRAALENYGIDSILAMNLTKQIEASFGPLPKTLFFEYQNIDQLADYFVESHAGRLTTLFAIPSAPEASRPIAIKAAVQAPASGRRQRQRFPFASTPAQAAAPVNEAVAIVGLSGRYPESRDLDAFWRNLRDGTDCIVEVPKERWDWRAYYSEDRTREGAHYSKWGGFIEGVDEFDPRFFNIAPREAASIDPQERLFLQYAWNAIEDAGYTRDSLQIPNASGMDGQVGVYAGVMYGEYNLSGSLASIANRVSYFLNLHGPSLTLDSMCSSSLSAIHLACQDLGMGRTSLAIAGGVNVSIHPNKYTMLSGGQFISSDGHCESFGEGGGGYIPGEGVGVAVLKRLSDAERDGNHIYGVIRGSALNHGGKTNGYTVPNPQAQADVIRRALAEAAIDPRHVSYIEAHGTGTKLGDPIEIAALTRAFHEGVEAAGREAGYCLIGSAKSNIGHCESAAGIAGVTKVLLQMKHGAIVPSLHSSKLNPHIDFASTPFVVNQTLKPWRQPEVDGRVLPRIAGISSFGAGGSNAHVIIEEYRAPARAAVAVEGQVVVPLSARTQEQLQQRVAALLSVLEGEIDLRSMAHTLQVGREAMEERAAFLVASSADLAAKLTAFMRSAASGPEVYRGQVKQHRDEIAQLEEDPAFQDSLAQWIADRDIARLAGMWVKGAHVDWSRLADPAGTPRLMSLPAYPFAKERYWNQAKAPTPAAQAAPMHPLVHANTSSLAEQGYTSTFTGSEDYLVEEAGRKTLPPHLVLDMMCAAVELASPKRLDAGAWEVGDVVWGEPVVIAAGRQLGIALFARDENAVDAEIYNCADNVVYCQGRVIFGAQAAPLRLPPAAGPREIRLGTAPAMALPPLRKKPAQIALQASVAVPAQAATPKATFALMELTASSNDAGNVRLFDLGEGVFSIDIDAASVREAIGSLSQAFERARGEPALKVLLLNPRRAQFWRGDRAACNEAVERGLPGAVAAFPYPVVAVVRDGASGAGMLLAALCDFIVRGEGGACGFTNIGQGIVPSAAEERLFQERLGASASAAFLYRTGREPAIGIVVPKAQVDAKARQLAADLSRKSRLALGLLKTHLGRHMLPLADALGIADPAVAGPAEGIAVVKLGKAYGVEELMADLKRGFQPGTRVAIVTSALQGYLPKTDDKTFAALRQLVRDCPIPLIAAFEGDAEGMGWLFGISCDMAFYRHDARYITVPVTCTRRFGRVVGQEIGLAGGSYSGADLGALAGDPLAQARELAALWSKRSWKPARSVDGAALPDAVADVAVPPPGPVALRSRVVTVTAHADGVVVVGMQDRDDKNMFSEALVGGLKEAFAHIEQTPGYKAVVLTGYDSYFATGGTMETLLAIQDGQAQFTDEKVFQLPMDCSLPVIAAIQGHGIGGGWSFGMFADVVMLSEESRYLSPYMGYGFTPGAGSTLMFPAKIGYDLARETLLSANEMSGRELKERGVPLTVLPRREVVPAAIALAARMAQQPRARLVQLKRLSTEALRAARDNSYRREVDMHEQTFVKNADTLGHIQAKLVTAKSKPVAASVKTAAASSSVIAKLKTMLAHELFLAPEEIDEDTQFIDLGLDSITGVTWIRKINAHYGTDIEATKVYSHPTLKQLSQLVAGVAVEEIRTTPPSTGPVVGKIKQMLARELHLGADEIDETTQFIDMGLDSITGVTWVRKINEHYGTDIEATKVYSHPTLEQFARLLQDRPAQAAAEAPPVALAPVRAARSALVSWRGRARVIAAPASPVVPALPTASQQIAVIGMAGQFAKANDLDQFWTNLAEGRNCIEEVSDTRWNLGAFYQEGAPTAGKTNSKWLGALAQYDMFDPLFFSISPTEAECMDPQQRLFLQSCWHSIENAGYNPQSLSGSQCGVFVGCGPSDYLQAAPEQQLSAQGFTGAASSILAARISYFLNLRGPCVSIETACSSSLVAIASACDSLNAGNSDLALAGGVYVMAGPAMHIMTAQAGMLSVDGRCFSFDQRANGFVPGEGVGVMMLKRLADAERDNDRIQAVIEGWGVNQDGKTNGITAPNEESQTRLLQSVYRKFGIDPAGIGLVEAHGTGTKLGDPIEVAGLKEAFKPFTDTAGFCALGSVKSNIGHCLTAAGAAGFIKLVLALRHRALPPTINFERRNEHFQLDGSPFYINDTLKPWTVAKGAKRRAAISSFGFSGTNAHIVVAEHQPGVQAKAGISIVTQHGAMVLPLSARTEQQLRQGARDLLDFIDARKGDVDLGELACTLQLGRDAMGERLGILAASVEELRAKLAAYTAGATAIDGVYQGQVKRHKEGLKLIVQDDDMKAMIVDKWLGQRALGKLLDLWVKGLDLDWSMLYGDAKPQRMALPGYPFAKERFWIGAGARNVAQQASASVLHPLLHRNVSVLSQQRYRSSFSGDEACFEQTNDGVRVMAPSALLEMARLAVQHASGDLDQAGTIDIAEVSWETPLRVTGKLELVVDLFANDDDSIAFEIYTAGAQDQVHVRGVADFVEQAADHAVMLMTTPRWDTVKASADAPAGERVVVVNASGEQRAVLEPHYAAASFVHIAEGDSVDDIGAVLKDVERLIWIASAHAVETFAEETIIGDQRGGIMQLLRIMRALASLGDDKRALAWDIVTLNSLPVLASDVVNPTHAGLQGFSGSLSDAYPRWQIRMLDLQAFTSGAVSSMQKLPWTAKNACYAMRGGEWFAQKLVRVDGLADAKAPYRTDGVYVVIGGSGGLGEIWSRHAIEQCRANVIWIGRRELNAEIRQKLDSFASLGKTPEYIQADASKPGELAAACQQIKRKHPVIHGVVHCAVGAFDQSLKTVSEDDFRAVLSVKIDLSVRIAQVFKAEALDFALFFSSNASFVRGAGMSGYSAGCTFKDAFALQLGKHWDCAVKVVNWGYWSVGAGEALSDATKAYFKEIGYRPLDPVQGMRALDRFIASGIGQMSIASTVPHAGAEEWMSSYDNEAAAAMVVAHADIDRMNRQSPFVHMKQHAGQEMEALIARLLGAILADTPAVLPAYERWRTESTLIAMREATPLAALWAEWDEAMIAWQQVEGRAALCQLVDKCLRALPDILTGKRKATDVLFPNSSLELVERVYKSDTLSLAYNVSLSETLVAAVQARLKVEPDARIRMLEIGAGTGATTVSILDKLRPYQDRIAEYCYTDLSKAFLFHAENNYAPRAPYLVTRIFNVEQPVAQQVEAGSYDVVIAANVIHATKNIRNAVRNAKAVLRKGGMLLLNEISDKSICGHLTFGLLDGWWLNEDDEVRIPGSPGLYPDAWKMVLEEEGFHSVRFPCSEGHAAGQQIIMAFSDGVVRQRAVVKAPAAGVQTAAPRLAAPGAGSGDLLRDKTVQFCKQVIGKALKITSHDIDASEPLERYGIDSIIIGLVNQELQKHFDEIGSTLLYEFQTVEAIAAHLIDTQLEKLESLFEADRSAQAPAPVAVRAAAPVVGDEALRAKTVQFCQQLFGKALKIDRQLIDPEQSLELYGIDSVSVSLVNQQLQQHFGDVGSTLLYQFQTVHALAGHLVETQGPALARMFALENSAPQATVPAARPVRARQRRMGPASPRTGQQKAIAIIGISGMYPGADSLEQFWENLKSGKDSIGDIPEKRWAMDGFYEPDEHKAVEQGKSYSKRGGFIDRFAEFDTLFFGIPPREALNMDPQERLFMQASWSAMENAAYTRSVFKRNFKGRVGVFAGITRAGYSLYRNTAQSDDKFWPRTSFSSVANRLSYFMDLNGPSLPVDTMCSSSLTAIHEACKHINDGDCDLAFAGGVNLYLHPTSYVDMSSQHMLSKDGMCKSFGEAGNGFVPGEGVGVVLLKSLEQALRDKDIIHGVILSTHVNHGGKTNGFTVPNPVAQAELVRIAIDKAGISARDISYIEAHGTGTELGDPIEIAGLQQAFAKDTQDKGYCMVGSAKSNIGHLEAAAGIAGLTKVLLQLKHEQLAPSLHASTLNPHIRFEKTPFKVNQALAAWERPLVDGRVKPRIAGISSFGAGGANAHVIVQEYQAARSAAAQRNPDDAVIVPLSAKSAEQLRQKAVDLRDFLRASGAGVDLGALAYTLQVGREPMEMRVGFVVTGVGQLLANLGAYVDGDSDIDGSCRGQVQRNNDGLSSFMHDEDISEAIDKWIARKKFSKLLELWARGMDFDWSRLHGAITPGRMQLPTYPFARDEYWIDSAVLRPPAKAERVPAPHASLRLIEDLIDRIDESSLDATQGAQLLRKLV
ncbi:SDR family NAD(P)-dependent oxidoreductase [Massilia atriviolacea]|uniref:SDR family NAD(P)-dependent oxidoreductase n=1 Tax=Massilia atriviolacea TaxID=2495579 RepID=A0A430HSF1_9BURK|nr:SDR family NAD(P)-dependent oxidoreductase [Massilia atriviolacea]RSZ60417.1 SDR family NAD(P)-dependent oxidoreductase [Massilia atriviolacea]